ncbi:MAG: hypothetical protein E4H14_01995, partial [Candidatus Thorarchaeota archaeon]
MTCIVGIEHEGKVYLGGDRLRGGSSQKSLLDQPKLFIKDNSMIFGYSTSFRFGNLLQYSLTLPKRTKSVSDEHFLYVDLIKAV